MYKRILVPVDGSDASKRGLQEAVALARELGAELKLVHAVNELIAIGGEQMLYYDVPNAIEALREGGRKVLAAAQKFAADAGVAASAELIEGVGTRAAGLILESAKAWPADLIAMGTHGRRGLGRWALGSDAENVLRASSVPVLLVRVPE